MKTNVILNWEQEATYLKAELFLTNGKPLLTTTDTVIGLLAKASEYGKYTLDVLKKRTCKPYIILLGNIQEVTMFAQIPSPLVWHIMQTCWPGPLTIVLPTCNTIRSQIGTSDETIAIRIPAHRGLQHLLTRVPALFSTSANISGEPVPHSIEEISQHILDGVSCIIFDKDDPQKIKNPLPSTIIQATDKDIMLIREGAYPVDIIEKKGGKKLKLITS